MSEPMNAVRSVIGDAIDQTVGHLHSEKITAIVDALLTLHPSLAAVLDGTGVVVPVKPTEKMQIAAYHAGTQIEAQWSAMLAARPKPADPAFDKILQEQLERDRFPRLTQRGRNE